MERYNQIVPGAADRILKMAEDQAVHRMGLEKSVIASDIKKSEIGQWFAFIIAFGGLVISVWSIFKGMQLAGGLIGSIDIASLAGLFIYGRSQKAKEREFARRQNPQQ
jgi:uncharacterized membrane protein